MQSKIINPFLSRRAIKNNTLQSYRIVTTEVHVGRKLVPFFSEYDNTLVSSTDNFDRYQDGVR